jgi:hypothetical protein
VLADPELKGTVVWSTRMSLRRSGHRPDLAVFTRLGLAVVEVELQRKDTSRTLSREARAGGGVLSVASVIPYREADLDDWLSVTVRRWIANGDLRASEAEPRKWNRREVIKMPSTQRGQAYKLGSGRWGLRYYDAQGVRQRGRRSRPRALRWPTTATRLSRDSAATQPRSLT